MQITTITFFNYQTLGQKLWGFGMMQFAHRSLAQVKGLQFYKLMGSGRGSGFNPYPDWSTYALLQVWRSEADADAFFQSSTLLKKYRAHTREVWTLYMHTIVANGQWSGYNPFKKGAVNPENPLLAVITRATIKPSRMRAFWKYVPMSEKPLSGNEGLLFKKGIGEVPVLQMATFSIWKDEASLTSFAYKSREHAKAIRLTRELDWYSEEMFSRFQPYRSVGTWQGKNPLPTIS